MAKRRSEKPDASQRLNWHFTDDEVINWMRRHDVSASVMDARAMMDDAASLHLVRVVPTPPRPAKRMART